MLTDVLLSLPYALLLCWILLRSPLLTGSSLRPWEALSFLGIKWAAGIFLALLYTYYYTDRSTGDIFRFYDDGLILKQIFFDNPADFLRIMTGIGDGSADFRARYFDQMNTWIKPYGGYYFNDNRTMVRLNALLAFVSFNNYQVHSVIVTFLSFLGLLLLYRSFESYCKPANQMLLKAGVFLTPSVLLWTSGVLKESLLMFALGVHVHAWLSILKKPCAGNTSLFLVSTWLLCLVKLYFLAAVVPAYMAHFLATKFFQRKTLSFVAIWGSMALLAIAFSYLVGFDLLASIARKQRDFVNHGIMTDAGSLVPIPSADGGVISFIASAASGLFNLFLRPLPWNINTLLLVPPFLENVCVLLVFLIAVFTWKAPPQARLQVFFLVAICMPVMVLIGLTTPIIGAFVRYKAPALVLFLIALVLAMDLSKIKLLLSRNER